MTELEKSISQFNGDPKILPFSKTVVTNSYWSKKHPGYATGQITRNKTFGNEIYKVSKIQKYKTYLEVGTWCGLGTTKCLLDGIIVRDDAKLISLESNRFFHETTNKYWSKYFDNYNIDKNKFKLYYGSLISYDGIQDDFITDGGQTKETYDYAQDVKNAPIITIDEKIDVLCLDGGHSTTYKEWNKFKDEIKMIILDDTKTSKTRVILTEIFNSPLWQVVYTSNDRNGELIAMKN